MLRLHFPPGGCGPLAKLEVGAGVHGHSDAVLQPEPAALRASKALTLLYSHNKIVLLLVSCRPIMQVGTLAEILQTS